MKSQVKSTLKYVISLVLAAVLVFFAFRGVDWKVFWDDLGQTRWFWVAMFIAASVGAIYFRTLRWRMLLRVFEPGIRNIEVFDAINVGNFVNVVLPGAGEFIRCGYTSKGDCTYEKSFGTILIERISDFAAIIVLFVVALSLNWSRFGSFFRESIMEPLSGRLNFSAGWLLLIIAGVVAALIFLIWKLRHKNAFFGMIVEKAGSFAGGFVQVAKMEGKGVFFLYTILVWLMYILMSWFGLKAIPMLEGLTFVDAIFISAIGNIASVIPVPGGIGAYHYLVAVTISTLYGQAWDTGILYATLCHESHAVLILIMGAVSYIFITLRSNKQKTR